MSFSLDLYVPGRSWLHRCDPRVKLWLLLLGVALAFRWTHPLTQALYVTLLLLVLRLAGITGHSLGWLWHQMRPLVLLMLLLQPFFTPSGKILAQVGPLTLTVGGLNSGALLALRILAMAFLTGGLLFTTDQRALVQAFVRLGLPYTWGLTVSLTLRFLPAIGGLATTVREAQASRGWVAEGNFIRRARDYLPVLIAIVIGALRLSDQLALALAARGLGYPGPRTTWRKLQMRRLDWWVLGWSTVGFIGAWSASLIYPAL